MDRQELQSLPRYLEPQSKCREDLAGNVACLHASHHRDLLSDAVRPIFHKRWVSH
jgi:hypothetical protein